MGEIDKEKKELYNKEIKLNDNQSPIPIKIKIVNVK